MKLNVLVLPGDGIGVEVTREAVRVLRHVARKGGHELALSEGLLGGIAIHKTGSPLPEETKRLAAQADATLMGAVGLPEFDNAPPEKRPEKGLLGIRQALGVYANLRPVRAHASQLDSSPLKNHLVEGADMIIVRELTGGIYYGTPRGITEDGAETRAVNTMTYTRKEIERVSRVAFRLAQARRKKVTSVDKSNVLENSQLWRRVVVEVAREFPDVALDHLLVDNCAMQLILNPRRFDVIVTENMFGDILMKARCWPDPSACCPRPPSATGGLRARGWGCTSRYTVRRPTSPARTRPTRSAPSAPWRPCSNTVSA
jgi:3-isopropylmalate dehydrogenase